jgi:hypothetical protein
MLRDPVCGMQIQEAETYAVRHLLNPGARVPQLGVAYQPAFFYEQLWDVLIFAILWQLRKRISGDGQLLFDSTRSMSGASSSHTLLHSACLCPLLAGACGVAPTRVVEQPHS